MDFLRTLSAFSLFFLLVFGEDQKELGSSLLYVGSNLDELRLLFLLAEPEVYDEGGGVSGLGDSGGGLGVGVGLFFVGLSLPSMNFMMSSSSSHLWVNSSGGIPKSRYQKH